ncbi:homeobox protein CHOX-CAD-like [Gigantopelta aegis]|uniref:homeobox protein CHOX-CAD-like n=1 Tax=Gigantopelta aegis TaxID=1735272 RepID=UPI001B88A95E|nr:homeobox protein CHOX-CAD-like [Gigantopelta aegis]
MAMCHENNVFNGRPSSASYNFPFSYQNQNNQYPNQEYSQFQVADQTVQQNSWASLYGPGPRPTHGTIEDWNYAIPTCTTSGMQQGQYNYGYRHGTGMEYIQNGAPVSQSVSPHLTALDTSSAVNTCSPNSTSSLSPGANNKNLRAPFEWMKPTSSMPVPGKTRTKDKYRVVYSDHQRLELEKEFHFSRYITIRRKAELANLLQLSERQVKIWFQNRRAKERKVKKKEEGFQTTGKMEPESPPAVPHQMALQPPMLSMATHHQSMQQTQNHYDIKPSQSPPTHSGPPGHPHHQVLIPVTSAHAHSNSPLHITKCEKDF